MAPHVYIKNKRLAKLAGTLSFALYVAISVDTGSHFWLHLIGVLMISLIIVAMVGSFSNFLSWLTSIQTTGREGEEERRRKGRRSSPS